MLCSLIYLHFTAHMDHSVEDGAILLLAPLPLPLSSSSCATALPGLGIGNVGYKWVVER